MDKDMPPSPQTGTAVTSEESDDGLLMLSGLQHYYFCPRQWGLIHLEQQWADNRLTVEGSMLHERVDDPFFNESCGGYPAVRSLPVVSRKLGLYGVADLIEMRPDGPYPVEYKRGCPKRGLLRPASAMRLCDVP